MENTEAVEKDLTHRKEELADVLIYGYLLASRLNLSIDTIIQEKLEKSAKKYSIEQSRGKKVKYTKL